jgi:hypothetical protein
MAAAPKYGVEAVAFDGYGRVPGGNLRVDVRFPGAVDVSDRASGEEVVAPPVKVDPWIEELFRSVDSLDAAAFAKAFTDDGAFRFANNEPAVGKRQIERASAEFFSAIGGLSHEITGVWSGTWEGGVVKSVESKVTYTRVDGTVTAPLPAVSTMRMRGKLIEDFQVFVDLSPVFGAQIARS